MPFIYSFNDDTSSTQNKVISKSFTNETVKSVFEFYFMLPSKIDGMSAQIKSGRNAAIIIITKNGNLCYENSSGTAVSVWDNYIVISKIKHVTVRSKKGNWMTRDAIKVILEQPPKTKTGIRDRFFMIFLYGLFLKH